MSKVMGTIYKVGREKESERAIDIHRERDGEKCFSIPLISELTLVY